MAIKVTNVTAQILFIPAIFERSVSDTIALSEEPFKRTVRISNVTTQILQLAALPGPLRNTEDTMYLAQNVLYVNLIADRQVPEHDLGLTDSAYAFGNETVTHNLGITDSVSVIGPMVNSISHSLGMFDQAIPCLAGPWGTIEVSHKIEFVDWANIPYEVALVDNLGLTDVTKNITAMSHHIMFVQTVIAGNGLNLRSTMDLISSLNQEIGYERGTAHTEILKDAFTYYIDNGCNLKQYNAFEGSGETDGIDDDLMTFDADFSIESLSGIKDLLYLRSPETDDKQKIGYNRINRESRGGELQVFSDPNWPQVQSLLFTIVALSDGGCQPDKIGQLLDFFQDHLGEEILIHDWEGLTWQGVITTPNEVAVEDSDGWWTISFEFEGVASDGSYEDQKMVISDSVGLAADWVRFVNDDLGISDTAMASILGTIAVSVTQDLGLSHSLPGEFSHTILEDSFNNTGLYLDGQSPDVGNSVWQAPHNYKPNGTQTPVNAGAYYPFAPANGNIYDIIWEARSLSEYDGSETRFFLGEGLSTTSQRIGPTANGNVDPTTLKAGFVMRKVTTQRNACRLGDDADGQADTVDFTSTTLKTEADDLDMRLVFDTSGGTGHWKVTWYAKDPTDSDWTEVRSEESLLSEDITMVGWSNNSNNTTVTMNFISINRRDNV